MSEEQTSDYTVYKEYYVLFVEKYLFMSVLYVLHPKLKI